MKKLLAVVLLTLPFSALAAGSPPIPVEHPAPSDPDAWMGAQPDVRVRVKPIRDTALNRSKEGYTWGALVCGTGSCWS